MLNLPSSILDSSMALNHIPTDRVHIVHRNHLDMREYKLTQLACRYTCNLLPSRSEQHEVLLFGCI